MNTSLVAPLALAALTVLAGCSRTEAPKEPIRAVRTLTVGVDSTSAVHDYAAEIRARTESRLGFRVGGKLVAREVNLGDSVRQGQVLARLDGQDLRLGQDAARAALSGAQTQLDLAQADLRRYRELREQGFIGAAELERREATAKAAQAQLDQARAQSSVQGNQAGYASLLADAAGVVTAVEAEPGQVLSAGTPVLRLALDGPRDAVFSVPEDRLGAVRALIGQPGAVKLRLWGQTDESPATVREVSAAADPTTRTFLVKADVGRTPVRLGQTASIRIAEPRRDDAIRLPLAAVVEAKGQSVVWLLDTATMKVRQQPVQVGGADGNLVLIAAGLKPGDRVVTAGTHVLTPGQQVRLYQAASPASAATSPAPLAVSTAASAASR